MAIWVELRCDNGYPEGCYSSRNQSPEAVTRNNREGHAQDVAALFEGAKVQGWLRRGGKLYCPNCVKLRGWR